MARVTEYGTTSGSNPFENDQSSQADNTQIISADQQGPLQVPGDEFIADADILRDGQDLILEAPDGSTIVIEGYFNADPAPMITAPDGSALTPKMVLNFVQDAGDLQYARADSVVDESPVGQVLEVDGQATVTRVNGASEPLVIGMKVYEGDIIETSGTGAVNIQFVDDSTFAVSENARLAIDEYVFDPQTDSGSTNFSVLRGLFVFTSGLIGRDDPDDVQIDTPVGSIGIRGTTIMGNVDTGEITVVEGAIVMRSYDGTEMTLDEQFETGRFEPATGEIVMVGTLSGDHMAQNFDSVSGVMPSLFSGFADTGADVDPQQEPAAEPILVADAGTEPQDPAETGDEATTKADSETTADGQTSDDNTTVASADGTTTDGQTGDTTTMAADDGTTTVASADGTTTDGQPTDTTTMAADDGTTTVASADGTTTDDQPTDTTTADTTDPFVVAGNTGFTDAAGTTDSTSDGGVLPGSTNTTGGSTTTAGTASTTSTTGGSTTTAPPPPPPPLDLDINHLAVDDSLAAGQVIAVVGTTYDFPDVQFTLLDNLGGQITLVDGPGNKAAIQLVSGSLTAGDLLDISVAAKLPDGRTTTEHFGVDVVNTNTTPTINNGSSVFAVDENSANGTSVGQVIATDADSGQTLSYSILSGAPAGLFNIDSSGNITVNGALDFETTNTYNLNVRVQDNGSGTLYDTAAFTVNINDVNEAPVLGAPGGNYTIAENAATSAVVVNAATMSGLTSDPDTSDTLTYSIIAGNTGSAFTINTTTGEISVAGGGVLDYDGGPQQYNLTVQVQDNGTGTLTDTQTFTIDLTGVDDEATSLDTNAGASVGEGSTTTLTTSMLSSSDLDTADSGITYTITTLPTGGHIALASAAGVSIAAFTQDDLASGNVVYVHNGSVSPSDSFAFTVGDGANGTVADTFSIAISDVTAPSLEVNGTGTHISGLSDLSSLVTGLHLMFDEDVQAGTGNIVVRDATNSIISTIDVTDTSLVTFAGGEMKVRIPNDLQYDTSYYVEIDSGAVTDTSGNAYAGFAGSGTFDFTTARGTFLTTVGGLGSDAALGALELFDPVSPNKSEGYIVVGEATSGGQKDIMITKIDNHGFVEDVSVLGTAATDEFAGIAHNAAGVFIAGTMDGAGAGSNDFTLTNVDLDGNVIWSNTYGTAMDESAEDVAASSASSNVFIVGTTQATNTMATVTGIDGSNGNMSWSVNLSTGSVDVSAEAILSMSDAKYSEDLIVGGDKAVNGGDMMIARLSDADGSLAWSYTIDVGNATDDLEAMAETSGGGLLLAGSTTSGDSTGDALLVKLSTDGGGNTPTIDWALTFGVSTQVDIINDVTELSDGRIAIAGSYNSTEGFVAVLNADGSWSWGESFSHNSGATGAYSVEETANGALLISGQTTAGVGGVGGSDAFTMQMTLNGQIQDSGGTSINSGTIDSGSTWTLSTLSAGIINNLAVGTEITMASDGTISSADAVFAQNGTGYITDTGDDIDHAGYATGSNSGIIDLYDTVAANDATLNDSGFDGVLSGFDGNDTFNINGRDVVSGGTGNDIINMDGSSRHAADATIFDHDLGYIDGGVGNDVFRLDSNHDLDLSMMKDGDSIGLANIEKIDLMDTNSNAQQLTLSYDAIVAMTDSNNALVIVGDTTANNDSVIVDLAAVGAAVSAVAGTGAYTGYTDYSVTGADGTIHLYVADSVDQTGITT